MVLRLVIQLILLDGMTFTFLHPSFPPSLHPSLPVCGRGGGGGFTSYIWISHISRPPFPHTSPPPPHTTPFPYIVPFPGCFFPPSPPPPRGSVVRVLLFNLTGRRDNRALIEPLMVRDGHSRWENTEFHMKLHIL